MRAEFQYPRSVTILKYVNDFLLMTSTKHQAFADDVVKVYHARVPSHRAREIRFHENGEPAKDLKANEQIVMRIVSRNVRFPADLEEAVVLAMPDPWQSNCLRDLAERYGRLSVRIPVQTPVDDMANFQRMMKETGEAIAALGPVLANGRVDAGDVPHAETALREIGEAIAELVGMQARIKAIVPDVDEGVGNVRYFERG